MCEWQRGVGSGRGGRCVKKRGKVRTNWEVGTLSLSLPLSLAAICACGRVHLKTQKKNAEIK